MLVEFNITNFRSIKEKVTLSMVAAKTKEEEHPENTFEVEGRNLTLLKSAVLYGANASGKSNIVKALYFMRKHVLTSSILLQPDEPVLDVVPFKLSKDFLKKPSTFEVTFIQGSEIYTYGFSLTAKEIHKEWLYATRKNRQRLLFERDISRRKKPYHFGESWKGEKKPLQDRTRTNTLFLSVASQFNNQDVEPVVDWFTGRCKCLLDNFMLLNQFSHTIELLTESGINKSVIEKLLKVADLGIEGVDIQKAPILKDPSILKLPEVVREVMQSLVSKVGVEKTEISIVNTTHVLQSRSKDYKQVVFDLHEESSGTIKFFMILGPWISMLQEGQVLFIDEFEKSFHPLLSRYLIKMLHDAQTKKYHPQLIFTTHDTNLLDSELFRRDQIWFTEKSEAGSTKLYSLWDMEPKPRISENFRSGYLKGRYGAIPFIDDFELEDEKKQKIRK